MTIETVAAWSPGHAAEQKLHQLEVFFVLCVTGENKMRAGAVSGGHGEMRGALTERTGLTIKKPRVGVEPVGERGRKSWIEQRSFREDDFKEIVEAFVEQHGRIEGHDHVDAKEELAEALMDMKI